MREIFQQMGIMKNISNSIAGIPTIFHEVSRSHLFYYDGNGLVKQ